MNKLSFKFSKEFVVIVFSICMGIACGSASATQDVELTWNASTEPNVAGYKVYWGTASSVYTSSLTVIGIVPTATIVGLLEGSTYYFAITAYDADGWESVLSPELTVVTDGGIEGSCEISIDSTTRRVQIVWKSESGLLNFHIKKAPTPTGPWDLDSSFDLVDLDFDVGIGKWVFIFKTSPAAANAPVRFYNVFPGVKKVWNSSW